MARGISCSVEESLRRTTLRLFVDDDAVTMRSWEREATELWERKGEETFPPLFIFLLLPPLHLPFSMLFAAAAAARSFAMVSVPRPRFLSRLSPV